MDNNAKTIYPTFPPLTYNPEIEPDTITTVASGYTWGLGVPGPNPEVSLKAIIFTPFGLYGLGFDGKVYWQTTPQDPWMKMNMKVAPAQQEGGDDETAT